VKPECNFRLSHSSYQTLAHPCPHLQVQESDTINQLIAQELVEFQILPGEIPFNSITVNCYLPWDLFTMLLDCCIQNLCNFDSMILVNSLPCAFPIEISVTLQQSISESCHPIASVPKLWGWTLGTRYVPQLLVLEFLAPLLTMFWNFQSLLTCTSWSHCRVGQWCTFR
jgi:hypothetical protein